MTVQIPLKRKYLSAKKGTYKGGEKPAPKKHRHKIGNAEHVKRFGTPPVTIFVVDGRTGKGVFITTPV